MLQKNSFYKKSFFLRFKIRKMSKQDPGNITLAVGISDCVRTAQSTFSSLSNYITILHFPVIQSFQGPVRPWSKSYALGHYDSLHWTWWLLHIICNKIEGGQSRLHPLKDIKSPLIVISHYYGRRLKYFKPQHDTTKSDLVIPALKKTWKVPYYFKEKNRRGSGNMDQMNDLDTF